MPLLNGASGEVWALGHGSLPVTLGPLIGGGTR